MPTRERRSGPGEGSVRARLLDAAAQRFYTDGITATGIDAIVATAGVAKMSLYNNFASKATLVEAYIDRRHEEWLGLYRARLTTTTTAQERVLAVFDAYLDHAAATYDRGFRGCGLLNAAAELPIGDPGRVAVRRHKEQVERILLEHLSASTDKATARRLAEHFSFLLEGAMSRAGLDGKPTRLRHARGFAAQMMSTL